MGLKAWVFVALVCISASFSSQSVCAQKSSTPVVLVASVEAVTPLTAFSGRVTPVNSDPRFALTLRIQSTVPEVKELASAKTVTFGIHSPSLLFGADPTMGRSYMFSLRRVMKNGRSTFTGLRVQLPSEIDQRVAALIERMLKADTEKKAFSDLEALGCPAVPATIQRMDDRRSLADPQISLLNKSPDAFESMRHYGPRQVVDALAAILNQVTGQDFGFIHNGATDEERTKTILGWRKFLDSTPASDLCKAG
jgi:hypothetical protein